jgi:hypothetical protein
MIASRRESTSEQRKRKNEAQAARRSPNIQLA